MSHGHGWIQRKILEGIDKGDICFLIDMVFYVFDTENPTDAQYKSVARSVSKLEKEGYIRCMIFHWNPTLVWRWWNINKVRTSHRYYPSRRHYPKWSKQIFRIR